MFPSSDQIIESEVITFNERNFSEIQRTTNPKKKLMMDEDSISSYVYNLNIYNAKSTDQGIYLCLGFNNLGLNFKEVFLKVATGKHFSKNNMIRNIILISVNLILQHKYRYSVEVNYN